MRWLMQRFMSSKFIVAVALVCCAAAWVTLAPPAVQALGGLPASADAGGFFELRVYTIKPDMWKGTLQFMENANRFQVGVGMNILGHFADQVENKYIWMRAYPDEATRLRRYKDVYESEVWKSGQLRQGIESGINGTEVYLSKPTKHSKLQYPPAPAAATALGSAKGALVFEVTLSDIKPGMMDTWVKYMGEKVIPWEQSQGVRVFAELIPYVKVSGSTNGGTLTPVDNMYVAIRTFPDEATRQRQYQAMEDKKPSVKLGSPSDAGLEKSRVYRAHPTSYSQLQ